MLKIFRFGPLKGIICTKCGCMIENTDKGYVVISTIMALHSDVCSGVERFDNDLLDSFVYAVTIGNSRGKSFDQMMSERHR